jgi:LEA14-like dessication related protein
MSRPFAWTAALLCTGCVLATGTPPQVEVADVQLRGIGLLNQTLGVTLCVTNPNASELAFRRIQIALDTAGSPLAEGISEAPVRLPPHSSTLVPFTVVSTLRHLGPQLINILSTGAVEYQVRGSITLDTIGVTLPFSRSGRFGLLAAGQGVLAAGQGVLADAVAPVGLRCAPIL